MLSSTMKGGFTEDNVLELEQRTNYQPKYSKHALLLIKVVYETETMVNYVSMR
jgi:hypothetical protein